MGFPSSLVIKNLPAHARATGDTGSVPVVRKIPWRRKWQPTPVFCLENPMDRGAWWATMSEVHGVRESQKTRLSEHECTQLL